MMLESIRNILVPTDFSDLSEDALHMAAEFARRDDAAIHLLHSIRLPFLHTSYDINIPKAIWEDLREGTRERMAESQTWLEKAGIRKVGIIVSDANQPAEAIRRSVQELEIDLVVMATHGRRGIKHALVGSVTERALRVSPAPVLAVKGGSVMEMPIGRILLAHDSSNNADSATDLALSLAKRFGAEIDVLHVFEPISEFMRSISPLALECEERSRVISAERLQEVRAKLAGESLSVRTHLADGNPAEVISAEADRLGAELIVMGTHGHSRLDRMILGSVAERTLQLSACSVLLTRASDRIGSENN